MNFEDCDHGGHRSPFPIHSADASRYKAAQELLLLEDHIKSDPCPRCMRKHRAAAAAFLREASGLEGGRREDDMLGTTVERIDLGNREGALKVVREVRAVLL